LGQDETSPRRIAKVFRPSAGSLLFGAGARLGGVGRGDFPTLGSCLQQVVLADGRASALDCAGSMAVSHGEPLELLPHRNGTRR
jgi:hypothetical protein